MELLIHDLTKVYGSKTAVDCINLRLTPGVYGLLGANGAGKTTLMRMLCSILTPTSGSVTYDGQDILTMGEAYRDLLGYLPQDFGYYPDYNARDYLLYMAALKGLSRSAARQKTEELLRTVGLADVGRKKIKAFSGGMKQRLGIAQALLNDPKIMILDEPTAGLDPKERVRLRNLLADFAQDRIVLLSTHIVSDLEAIADRIFVMKDGRFLLEGTIQQLLDSVRGKVWELRVLPREARNWEETATVANLRHDNGWVVLRILSDSCPGEGAALCEPTLEDMYLYHFPTEG